MKSRTVKTAVSASVLLGLMAMPTAIPAASAATRASSHVYVMSKKQILLNGKLVSSPMAIAARDPNSHVFTTYMPIWYVLHALKGLGVRYQWSAHTGELNILPPPGASIDFSRLSPGDQNIRIAVNGVVVISCTKIVAPDPYSGVATTYMPIFYVKETLKRFGINSTWNGHQWNLQTEAAQPQPNPQPTVKSLTISGNTNVGVGQPDSLSVVATESNGATVSVPSQNVSWSVSDNNNGFISQAGRFVATQPGQYVVTASYGNVKQTFTISVSGQTAAVNLQPTGTLVANGQSTETITVQAVDASGHVAVNENGSVTVSDTAGWLVTGNQNNNPTVGHQVTVKLTNGVGNVQVQAPSAPGVSDVLSVSGLSDPAQGVSVQYSPLTVTSAPQVATSLKVTTANNQKYVSANQSGNTAEFLVTVDDQTGAPMTSGTYAFNVQVSGPATYTGPSTLVYTGGQSGTPVTVSTSQGEVGTITVTASANGMTPVSGSIQAVITQGAAKLEATGPNGGNVSFAEGSSVAATLTAVDANGYATTFPNIPFTAYVTNASGQVASNIVVNGVPESANGVSIGTNPQVTFADTKSGADAGTYTVTIKDSSGREWASFPIQETAASSNKLTLSASSSELTVANPNTTLTTVLTDTYGNPVPITGNPTVVLTATGGQGSATINGQDASKGVSVAIDNTGKATAQFSAQPYAGTTWTISASTANVPTASTKVNILNAVAASTQLGVKDAATGSTTVATAGDALQFSFGATDSYGNAYHGSDIFDVSFPTGAVVGLTGTMTTANGGAETVVHGTLSQLATDFAKAKAAMAGGVSFQLTDESLSGVKPSSVGFTINPGQFSGFAIFNSQGQVIDNNDKLPVSANQPVEAWIKPVDAFDNPLSTATKNSTVLLSDNGAKGQFRLSSSGTGITQLTILTGEPSVPVYYVNGTTGSYLLTASIQQNK